MKRYLIFSLSLYFSFSAYAQTRYYDAKQFPLIGKISEKTETRYERIPVSIKGKCRQPVWSLGKNTSGLAVRFRSNSTSVSAKWKLLNNNRMNHMTDTGIKGLDLYAWEDNRWQFVNSARPDGIENEKNIINNMNPKEREFMLSLPLYDGITHLEIGIDSLAYIEKPASPFPRTDNPIIIYGTSITQGGCATRPGMSYANILERKLNREIINLGFSGNGKLDYEIAEIMSERQDAAMFVLDFIPNVHASEITEKLSTFIQILRSKNPATPIVLVETVIFPHALFDQNTYEVVTLKNKTLHKEFRALQRRGDKNIHYITTSNLIGSDGEATVDGVHFTDLGFLRFANEVSPIIEKLIQNK